ncbi:class I SAM-dependent methyltransferase [Haloarchaeobius sp. TZWWS8]|uniref:class I SAM-dependent methyltransferase n=1 Tax=Haloarchaeobius sp. TZWWS8 TaxID=3446121 RepID=UPI003EBEA51C
MPDDAADLYDRNADAFDEATSLDNLPDEFVAILDSFVDALAGPAVLDAGCGPGRDVEYFQRKGLEPVGVDLAAGMLQYARENRPAAYAKMDVRALGFPDDSFDGVWCPATVFFVQRDEWPTVLGEFRRVLRPGGVARIGFKVGDGPVEVEKWGGSTVEYRVTEAEARQELEAAGFAIEDVTVNQVPSGTTFANLLCRLPVQR